MTNVESQEGYLMHNQKLDHGNEAKYLGVLTHKELSWKSHINYIIKNYHGITYQLYYKELSWKSHINYIIKNYHGITYQLYYKELSWKSHINYIIKNYHGNHVSIIL